MEEAFDLAAFLSRESERVEAALERSLARLLPLFRSELVAPARHAVSTGGKRLRPILCTAAYSAVGGPPTAELYDLAVSLELIHTYSLMHDDLPCMDDAELRRSKPTSHTLFGEVATTRSAMALIPAAGLQAYNAAKKLGCSDRTSRRIVRELNRAAGAGGMVGGQALDLLGEERELSAEELDGLHRRKTGALLTAPFTIAGLAAGAASAEVTALEAYGRTIGLAFQVADDILDATSSAEDLGKNPSDADLGKSTYVALHGLDEARRRAQELSDEARRILSVQNIRSRSLVALADYVVARRN